MSHSRNQACIRITNNIHKIMVVLYTLSAMFFFMGFVITLDPLKKQPYLLTSIIAAVLAAMHAFGIVLWRKSEERAKSLSICTGLILLLAFPIGTVFGAIMLFQMYRYQQEAEVKDSRYRVS